MVKPVSLGFLVQRRNNTILNHPTISPQSHNRNGQLKTDTVPPVKHISDIKRTTNHLNMTQFKKSSRWLNNENFIKSNAKATTTQSSVKMQHLDNKIAGNKGDSQHQTLSEDFVHTTIFSIQHRSKKSSRHYRDFSSYPQQRVAGKQQLEDKMNMIPTKFARHMPANENVSSNNNNPQISTTLMSIKNNKFRPNISSSSNTSDTLLQTNISHNIPPSVKTIKNVLKKPAPTKMLHKTASSTLVHSSTICFHCTDEQNNNHVHKTSRSAFPDKDHLVTNSKDFRILPSMLSKAKLSNIDKKKGSFDFPFTKTTLGEVSSNLVRQNSKLQSTPPPITTNSDQSTHNSIFPSPSSVPSFHSTHLTFVKSQSTPKPQITTTHNNKESSNHNITNKMTPNSFASSSSTTTTSVSPTSNSLVTNEINKHIKEDVDKHSKPKKSPTKTRKTLSTVAKSIIPTTPTPKTPPPPTTTTTTTNITTTLPITATTPTTTTKTPPTTTYFTTVAISSTSSPTTTTTTTTSKSKPSSYKTTTASIASSTSPPPPLPDRTTFPFTSTGKRLGTTRAPVVILSTVLVPFTTKKPLVPSYIIVRVTTSWYQFCQNKTEFCQEISQILEKAFKTPFNSSHISFINAEFSKCWDVTSAQNTKEERIIDIKLYILNSQGEYDQNLTEKSCNFISLGFGKTPNSRFYGMIKSVKLKQLNTDARIMDTGVTIAIALTTVGGLLCLVLLGLQIAVHRRRCQKLHMYMPSRKISLGSLDSIALGTMAQSRPSSGLYNAGMEPAEHAELSHPLNYRGLKNMCNDTDRIYDEFQLLPNICPKYSDLPLGVEEKNRYIDVLPIPETRVKLKTIPGEENSDYINANFITGPNDERKAYIATQAPLECTVADFWRMVWEQQARVIVMLTDMDERGMPKGTPYCPDAEDVSSVRLYGDHQVILRKKDFKPEYIVSNLELKDMENNLVRKLKHYWYTSWPAQGFPEPISFLKFILDVRLNNENKLAPLIVHCSSGTGRTGTLVAIDAGMKMFDKTQTLDVLNFVYSMRLERPRAVQTKQQYALIYKALLEYATMVMSPSISSTSSRTTANAVTYT
ncbi:signaling mucin MSB2-like [Argonauta hians]